MRSAAVAALLAAIASSALALAQDAGEPFDAEPMKPWGTPRQVLPPEFPKEALEKRHTGYVDMEGVVTPYTTFDVATYTADSEASRIFIEPLKQVVKHWTYYGKLTRDCRPTEEKVVTRVWFELDGDKPKISVSLRSADHRHRRVLLPIHRDEPRYPESMQRSGLQAFVYGRMVVDAAGNVTETSAHVFPEGNDRRPFARETMAALKRWKYPPADAATRIVCMEVIYRLR